MNSHEQEEGTNKGFLYVDVFTEEREGEGGRGTLLTPEVCKYGTLTAYPSVSKLCSYAHFSINFSVIFLPFQYVFSTSQKAPQYYMCALNLSI